MEKKHVWIPRDAEWIKNNPGEPTMYKHILADGEIPCEVKKKKEVPIEVVPQKESPLFSNNNLIVKNVKNPDKGIYVIICEKVKKVYVGQSVNMGVRLRSHKMTISSKAFYGKTSVEMRKDFAVYGNDGFSFLIHDRMPEATLEDLLSREGQVMALFVQSGYQLYNNSINKQVLGESIFCGSKHKSILTDIVKRLTEDSSFEEKLRSIL